MQHAYFQFLISGNTYLQGIPHLFQLDKWKEKLTIIVMNSGHKTAVHWLSDKKRLCSAPGPQDEIQGVASS
jgi:hypothetical protein